MYVGLYATVEDDVVSVYYCRSTFFLMVVVILLVVEGISPNRLFSMRRQ